MVQGQALQVVLREDLLHLAPEGRVEAGPPCADRILGEEKPAEGEIAPQGLPFFRAPGIEPVFPRHIEEGTEEKLLIRSRYDAPLPGRNDARPELDLLDDRIRELQGRGPSRRHGI